MIAPPPVFPEKPAAVTPHGGFCRGQKPAMAALPARPDHITDRIDAGDLGLVMRVDGQATAAIGGQPRFCQIELAGGARPADRIEGRS